MRFLQVALKGLREIFRDRKGLAFLLAFPAIFMLVFGFAFSGGQGDNNPYDIGVINRDKSVQITVDGESRVQNFGEELIKTLEGLTFEDSEVPLFEVRQVNPDEGEDLLKDREIACLVVVPDNFSASINQLINRTVRLEVTSRIGEMVIAGSSETSVAEPDELSGMSETRSLPAVEEITARITIKGDPGYIAFGQARGILSGVIGQFTDEITARARERSASYFGGKAESVDFVRVETESISGSESFSVFDYQAPGIFIFALLMSTIGVAGSLAREIEKGTLERLKLSRMTAFDFLFGTLLPWSILTVVQVVILFAVAFILGFTWNGGYISLLVAMIIAVIAGIASVSLGLLVAAFADNENHASNLGTLVAVPLSFIVGAFFPLPKLPIGKIFGNTFEIYDVLPWTHAAESLRMLLIFGGGISDIVMELVFLVLLTLLLFFVGVYFFSRKRLQPSE